ncbi:MAG: OB-fold nucleic acid binding domain-containing protein, partial [Casimicrobiaceae bacterium]
ALLNAQPMGFYAPAQLVQDARRHGVEVRPIDVMASDWDCTLELPAADPRPDDVHHPALLLQGPDDATAQRDAAMVQSDDTTVPDDATVEAATVRPNDTSVRPALRLGLRLVSGLSASGAHRIMAARREAPFTAVADLAHRAALDRRDLNRLAEADALASLAGHRHASVWDVAGSERLPALLANATFTEREAALAPPTEGQDVAADYRSVGLTLRRHPLAFLRSWLAKGRMLDAAALATAPHGRLVRVAGLVIGRQRPDTASGVIFVTLEDETGSINVIVWRNLSDRQRRELLGARLLGVYGTVEREGRVVHVLAGRLVDLSHLLGELPIRSRDFH